MLPKLHQEKLNLWVNLLTQFSSQLEEVEPTSISKSESWQQLQKIFGEEILTLTGEKLEPSITQAMRTFQTESHRCFRLLATDILFLESSKNESTKQQRLIQVRARLDQMIVYCQNLLSSS